MMVDIIAGIKNINLQLVSTVTKGEMTAASREAIGPPAIPNKGVSPHPYSALACRHILRKAGKQRYEQRAQPKSH
jgi:hypothetical protein